MFKSIRVVPRHIGHHGMHSGYDLLFSWMGIKKARSSAMVIIAGLIPKFMAWRLWLLRPQATQAIGMQAELGAAPWVAFAKGRLCHFIYGEDTYLFTPLWKNSRNRCIATFHYPPDRLIERVNPGPLRALDGVVVVGTNQIDYFARFLPREHIYFCPHHVDTDFFCPSPEQRTEGVLRLLCVGQVFRRHDDVLAVHRALCADGLEVETHVVGPKSLDEHPLSHEPGVHLHSGLSDEELLELYRTSSVGLLPMSDATANNSLLEMMACGLPVVTTDVGSVKDYTRGSAVRLSALGDQASLVEKTKTLLHSASLRDEEGRRNRDHAVNNFSLPIVAQRMEEIYRNVMSRKPALQKEWQDQP